MTGFFTFFNMIYTIELEGVVSSEFQATSHMRKKDANVVVVVVFYKASSSVPGGLYVVKLS